MPTSATRCAPVAQHPLGRTPRLPAARGRRRGRARAAVRSAPRRPEGFAATCERRRERFRFPPAGPVGTWRKGRLRISLRHSSPACVSLALRPLPPYRPARQSHTTALGGACDDDDHAVGGHALPRPYLAPGRCSISSALPVCLRRARRISTTTCPLCCYDGEKAYTADGRWRRQTTVTVRFLTIARELIVPGTAHASWRRRSATTVFVVAYVRCRCVRTLDGTNAAH